MYQIGINGGLFLLHYNWTMTLKTDMTLITWFFNLGLGTGVALSCFSLSAWQMSHHHQYMTYFYLFYYFLFLVFWDASIRYNYLMLSFFRHNNFLFLVWFILCAFFFIIMKIKTWLIDWWLGRLWLKLSWCCFLLSR